MHQTKTPLLQVAAKAAIVSPRGKVLIVQESAKDKNNTKVGLWGLVGGRLGPGEAFTEGLKREVMEETGLNVKIDGPIYIGEWRPVIGGVPHQIIAAFMLCRSESEEVSLSQEHNDYAWINPANRKDYPMMEPDCFVVDKLTSKTVLI